MNKSEIPFLPATELSGLIQSKEVSPVEATEAYLERIDQVDDKLNAYITVCLEEALAQGQASRAGHRRRPLPGANAWHSSGGERPVLD
jgi:Asp-tRNA(Asn)/Glu-tRNA(Gln) amidotransferase A subunit family amidase